MTLLLALLGHSLASQTSKVPKRKAGMCARWQVSKQLCQGDQWRTVKPPFASHLSGFTSFSCYLEKYTCFLHVKRMSYFLLYLCYNVDSGIACIPQLIFSVSAGTVVSGLCTAAPVYFTLFADQGEAQFITLYTGSSQIIDVHFKMTGFIIKSKHLKNKETQSKTWKTYTVYLRIS